MKLIAKLLTASSVFLIVTGRCVKNIDSKDGLNGTFLSPNYPAPYSKNLQCVYMFRGTIDERIKIGFESFDLEPGSTAGCLYDYIDIFTIDSQGMKHLESRLCGTTIPKEIISIHQTVELNFKTKYINTKHKGFIGYYEFIQEHWQPFPPSPDSCDVNYQSGVGGEITSPLFPKPYPDNIECTWMIKVEPMAKILLNFVELDLGQSVHCKETYIAIYNGFASKEGPPAERLCGQLYFYNKGVKEFISKTPRVVIRFIAHGNDLKSHGFHMAWTAVKLPEVKEDENGGFYEEPCDEFHCRGGEYCIDTSGLLCNPLPRYCIANKLLCNGVPNCGANDHSDEHGCWNTVISAVLGTFIPLLLIGIIAGSILFYHHHLQHIVRRRQKRDKEVQKRAKDKDNGVETPDRNGKHRIYTGMSHAKPGTFVTDQGISVTNYFPPTIAYSPVPYHSGISSNPHNHQQKKNATACQSYSETV